MWPYSFYLTLRSSGISRTFYLTNVPATSNKDCEHWVRSLKQHLVSIQLLKCCFLPFLGHSYKLSLPISYSNSSLPKPPRFVLLCVTTSANKLLRPFACSHAIRGQRAAVAEVRQRGLSPSTTGRMEEKVLALVEQSAHNSSSALWMQGEREDRGSMRHGWADYSTRCFCGELARQENSWVQDTHRDD